MPKDYSEIARAIAEADVVVGEFPETDAPDGKGKLIIKGKHLLESIMEKKQAEELRTVTVPCDNIEEAIAMRQTFGDEAKSMGGTLSLTLVVAPKIEVVLASVEGTEPQDDPRGPFDAYLVLHVPDGRDPTTIQLDGGPFDKTGAVHLLTEIYMEIGKRYAVPEALQGINLTEKPS